MSEKCAELRYTIPSTFESVADLAERIGASCLPWYGEDTDVGDMVRLCLAEALNNIVEHAYDGVPDRSIHAKIRLEPSRFQIVLIDEGKPMPGGMLPDGTSPFEDDTSDPLPEGGFGWLLIRSQMDGVDYDRRDGKNVLRLRKTVRV